MKLDLLFDPDYIEDEVRKARSKIKIGELRREDLPLVCRVEWEFQAAIMEYDGGLTRPEAERAALELILSEMRRHPP